MIAQSLDTLAQNGTNSVQIITGDGSEIGKDKDLKKRGQRKVIAQRTALAMIDVAKASDYEGWLKPLWLTYQCQSKFTVSEGKIYTKYCKNRFCTTCMSIRKADIINRYLPVIEKWDNPYFVTLTVKSCNARGLRTLFDNVLLNFRLIVQKYRKQNQRGKGIRLIGIKSLECCFNPIKRTYNPHLHLVVANREIAETLIKEWLSIFPKNHTTKEAQKAKPIYNLDWALVETIKYGSKIITPPDVKLKCKQPAKIYARAILNIYKAMSGLRIFDRFGFNLPKTVPKKRQGARVVTDAVKFTFVPPCNDWLSEEHEAPLTGYYPSASLIDILLNQIDTVNE